MRPKIAFTKKINRQYTHKTKQTYNCQPLNKIIALILNIDGVETNHISSIRLPSQ